jgi:hypothetical protein
MSVYLDLTQEQYLSGYNLEYNGVPKGIRTPVTAVKGRCPRPLDDGDPELFYTISDVNGQYPHQLQLKWRPQGDSNPCYRRERAMS